MQASTETAPSTVQQLVQFGAVGAFGGLCAFLLSRLLLIGPFAKSPLPLDLLAEIALGSLAALFGVYLLTASDLSAPRTFIFALACGFFWNPIITSTQAYVTQHTDNTTTSLATSAQQSTSSVGSQTPEQAKLTTATAANETSAAISKLSAVSPDARKQILESTAQTVKNLSSPVAATPASVQAVVQIANASLQNGATDVHKLTLQRLDALASTASNTQTRILARNALQRLAPQAK